MAQEVTRVFVTGDYGRRLNEALAAMNAAKAAGDDVAAEELAAEYTALRDESEAASVAARRRVTLRTIPRLKSRELREKHPPRTGEDVDPDIVAGDRRAGMNLGTVEEDLVFAALVEPLFEHAEGEDPDRRPAAFDEWADDLSDGEWGTIATDAWDLTVAKFDPKSLQPSVTRSGVKK